MRAFRNAIKTLFALHRLKSCCKAGERAYLSDFNLDGSVVLGANESVGGVALSGNVKFHDLFLFVLHMTSIKKNC